MLLWLWAATTAGGVTALSLEPRVRPLAAVGALLVFDVCLTVKVMGEA